MEEGIGSGFRGLRYEKTRDRDNEKIESHHL